MSFVLPRRAFALGFAAVIALLVVLGAPSRAVQDALDPSQAMTVTVVLDKASYLSGDTLSATAIVYRTPSPTNYTYAWAVRGSPFGRIMNTTANGTDRFAFPIPLNYTGPLVIEATVDDGEGLIVADPQSTSAALAVMALRLDRGDFVPGATIIASYSVLSHVILQPTYDYEVDDTSATIVLSGTTNASSFSFRTPDPASRTYAFLVTARDGTNQTQAQVSISQASGTILAVAFDKPAYAPGETIQAHLSLTARGTTSLPTQFQWTVSLGTLSSFGPIVSASAVTTVPEVDLALPIPQGLGTGDVLVFASEQATSSNQYMTVHIGITNALWTSELGGIPLFAVLLGLLFILILVAIVGLWRRVSGGPILPFTRPEAPAPPTPPSPPEGVARPPPAPVGPMSIVCRHCGKPFELSTSKRPIEVMCPSCGEPQLVT